MTIPEPGPTSIAAIVLFFGVLPALAGGPPLVCLALGLIGVVAVVAEARFNYKDADP